MIDNRITENSICVEICQSSTTMDSRVQTSFECVNALDSFAESGPLPFGIMSGLWLNKKPSRIPMKIDAAIPIVRACGIEQCN